MKRLPPISTRTDTLLPCTTLFRAVFDRIGEVLAATDGVTIASKAQILGTYDVDYEGSKFLLRVTKVQAGAYVSAVDPRGLPASGDAPVKLVAALKAALRSEEHTSELQSLMRISYAVFCLKKKIILRTLHPNDNSRQHIK